MSEVSLPDGFFGSPDDDPLLQDDPLATASESERSAPNASGEETGSGDASGDGTSSDEPGQRPRPAPRAGTPLGSRVGRAPRASERAQRYLATAYRRRSSGRSCRATTPGPVAWTTPRRPSCAFLPAKLPTATSPRSESPSARAGTSPALASPHPAPTTRRTSPSRLR